MPQPTNLEHQAPILFFQQLLL